MDIGVFTSSALTATFLSQANDRVSLGGLEEFDAVFQFRDDFLMPGILKSSSPLFTNLIPYSGIVPTVVGNNSVSFVDEGSSDGDSMIAVPSELPATPIHYRVEYSPPLVSWSPKDDGSINLSWEVFISLIGVYGNPEFRIAEGQLASILNEGVELAPEDFGTVTGVTNVPDVSQTQIPSQALQGLVDRLQNRTQKRNPNVKPLKNQTKIMRSVKGIVTGSGMIKVVPEKNYGFHLSFEIDASTISFSGSDVFRRAWTKIGHTAATIPLTNLDATNRGYPLTPRISIAGADFAPTESLGKLNNSPQFKTTLTSSGNQQAFSVGVSLQSKTALSDAEDIPFLVHKNNFAWSLGQDLIAAAIRTRWERSHLQAYKQVKGLPIKTPVKKGGPLYTLIMDSNINAITHVDLGVVKKGVRDHIRIVVDQQLQLKSAKDENGNPVTLSDRDREPQSTKVGLWLDPLQPENNPTDPLSKNMLAIARGIAQWIFQPVNKWDASLTLSLGYVSAPLGATVLSGSLIQ